MSEDAQYSQVTDIRSFWQAVGLRAVGAAVVTAADAAGPRGFLALSATHLCAQPPMMMVSVDEKTSALATIEKAGHFAINFLAAGQASQMNVFGGRSELKGGDRFVDGDWGRLATGAPTLLGAAGVIDCDVAEIIWRHGTAIVLGEVRAYEATGSGDPLVTYLGGTGRYLSER